MLSLKNFFLHPTTTIGGAILGCIQAAIGAVIVYAQSGAAPDMKAYAAVAVSAVMTFVTGGLMSGPKPPTDDPAKSEPAPPQDPKMQIIAQIEVALAEVAHRAMLAEAAKLQSFIPPAPPTAQE